MAFDIQGYHEKYKDLYGDVPLDEVAKDAFTRGGYDKEYPDYDTWKKATGIEGDIQTDLKKRTPKTWEDKLSEGVANVTPGFIPKDISTSFVKGATLNYVPSVETPADAGILRKGAAGAAHLAGMSVPIGIAALALPEAATVGGVMLTSGALGGLYGLLRKPEEGEDRLSNAAKDAAMFATFGVGGKVIGAGLKKLFPETVGKVFEKIAAKQELTPGEKAIYSASQYGTSATLMGGAGATEPADTWEQRLQNIATGMIVGAGAHGISSNLMKVVREGKATPDQLEYIKKLEAGANTSTIIDEGLKTGKIGEEVFTPNHALDLIKTANDSGVYSTEDVAKLKDRYESKYPDLKQGLNGILKDSIKNEISFGIDVGLKAGKLRGREFTPDDALEVIKDGREKGIYTDADIDSFRDKYPALKQGLNDIVVDSAMNKVNEALKISRPIIEEGKQLNKIIPKRNIETDVPLKLGEPVEEITKTAEVKPATDEKELKLARKVLPYYPAQKPTENDISILQEAKKLGKLDEGEVKTLDRITNTTAKDLIDQSKSVDDMTITQLEIVSNLQDRPLSLTPEFNNLRQYLYDKYSVKGQRAADITIREIKDILSKEEIQKFLPEPATKIEPPAIVDRRSDLMTRKKVSEMTPDERATSLLTDHLTGQKNKRAYEETERQPYQASIDVDGLKYVNDTFGHDAGNELLKKVGDALNRASGGQNNYHFHGDEFALEGKTPVEITSIVEKAKQLLKDEPLEFKGQKYTAAFSHGIAETMDAADKAMRTNKKERGIERGVKLKAEAETIPVKTKKVSIPENVVTRIMQEGGINFGEDYQRKYLKEYPDLKRVFKTTGKKPDAMANILKEEGYDIKGGDDLIEKLKT